MPFLPSNIAELQSVAQTIVDYIDTNPVIGTGLFILLYALVNSMPMPFISLWTILAGYLFGTFTAFLVVSFASAIGASCLFLLSRYLLKNWIQNKLITHSKWLSAGLANDSFWFATSLRLVPGMPLFIPSIALSFTKISLTKFYFSTQLGLAFILLVFVNAGNQLTQLNSIDDIFSINMIISMLLLALVPLALNLISKRFIKLTE